jgi:hypothetical protein
MCFIFVSACTPNHCRYAEYDAHRAAEINIKLATSNLNNNQNELVHRYASSNRRHAAVTDKGPQARDADECVVALRQAKAQVEAELKQATAEAKVRHSFHRSNADYKLVKFFWPSTCQASSEGEKSRDEYSGEGMCIVEALLYLS